MTKDFSLQKWWERNPIKTILGAMVSTGTVVAGIMTYFSVQTEKLITAKYEGQVAVLQDHLASINRGLAGGTYLNVSKLLAAC